MAVSAPLCVRSEEGSVSFDATGPRRSATWTVLATSDDDAREVLRKQASVERGTVYQDHQGVIPDLWAVCETIDISPLVSAPYNGTGLYSCRADFGYPRRQVEERASREGQVVARVERSHLSITVDEALDGRPIQNQVQEPIRGLSKIWTQYVLVLEWLQRFRSWEEAWTRFVDYDNKVNGDTFYGALPECLLCLGVTPEDVGVPGVWPYLTRLYRMTARFERKPARTVNGVDYGGWVDVILHQGYRLNNPAGTEPPYTNLESTEASNLNNGATAVLTTPPYHYLVFRHYPTVSFRGMLPVQTPGGGGG